MVDPILGISTMPFRHGRWEEESMIRQFLKEARAMKLKAFAFTPNELQMKNGQIQKSMQAKFLSNHNGRLIGVQRSLPNLVFDHCRFRGSPLFHRMQKMKRQYPNIIFLNEPLSNKWKVQETLLADLEIRNYLPESLTWSHPQQLKEQLHKFGTVYLKPVSGTGGRGVIRVNRNKNGVIHAAGRDPHRQIFLERRIKPQQIWRMIQRWNIGNYLIQKAIDTRGGTNQVRDLRMLVQKDEVGHWKLTGGAGRIGVLGSVTSNLHGGGKAVNWQECLPATITSSKESIISTLSSLCIRVATTLEKRYGRLCEIGLDIALDESGYPWLLEVNPKPAREIFRRSGDLATYRLSIRRPLQYAVWLHQQRP